jgi:hypothetical protein
MSHRRRADTERRNDTPRGYTEDYWRRTSRPIYGPGGTEVGREEAGCGIDAWAHRPPLGPPLLGWRSTAGGRGNRASASAGAAADRAELAARAVGMRLAGATFPQIAEAVGRSVSVVHRWLGRMPRGVAESDSTAAAVAAWVEGVEARDAEVMKAEEMDK